MVAMVQPRALLQEVSEMSDGLGDDLRLLQGQNAYVVVAGSSAGKELVSGLKREGARVALLEDTPSQQVSDSIISDFSSRENLSRVFQQAADRIGKPDLVVVSIGEPSTRESRPLSEYSDERWLPCCLEPLKQLLRTLQVAADFLRENSGAIVVIGPTVGHTGAAGLVALSTLTEGQRGLVKCAARQLGARGITVNWIGITSSQLHPELRELQLPHVPEMGPPALPLGRAPSVEEAASVIAFLGSSSGRALTGASLNLDGGEWMLP